MASRSVAAGTGIAAGLATLGAGELLAAGWTRLVGTDGVASPLFAVGSAFVDLTPAWLKDFAVATFGTADKVALGVGMGIVLAVAFAVVGLLAPNRPRVAVGVVLALGLAATAAVVTRPGGQPLDGMPTLLATGFGLWLLARLADAQGAPTARNPTDAAGREVSRRTVLTSVVVGVVGAAGIGLGRAISAVGTGIEEAVRQFPLPIPRARAVVPAGIDTGLDGHSTFVTPNDDFYRIDTALSVPRVDAEDWRLRVTGLVEREVEITYADLIAEEHVEAMVTLTCVSNEVGGSLVGNAVWLGWPVRHLLERAGVRPEADMVLSRSIDGWTAGTPLAALTDDRNSLLAVAMNGEPLPRQHGYPVRLVVPGLYGYVSATKWVTELKVTRFDADEGYWTPRGWAALGPIKTASRIDVPRPGGAVPEGTVTVAGVAWAQHRGISKVEVQTDDGDWHEATLLPEPTTDAWRLWRWDWADATVGTHTLRVRATDGDGEVQTDQVAPPAPDGASGWHAVEVRVG